MIQATTESYIERELADRVGWFIRLRWLAGPVVCLGTLLGNGLLHLGLPGPHLVGTGLGILVYNLCFWFYYRWVDPQADQPVKGRFPDRFIHFQITLDWVALAFVIHFSGGIQSPVLLFFVFHVLISSLLLSRLDCYLQSTLAILLVGGIALLESLGVLPHYPLYTNQEVLYTQTWYIVTYMLCFAAALYIAVFLTTSIAVALRAKARNLRDAQAQLVRAEKLAAMGTLAAGVAHEINNPLGGILAYTHLVLEDMEDDSTQRSNLQKVVQQTERCRDIVRGLLEFSRQPEPSLMSMDVNTVLEHGLALLQNQPQFRQIEMVRDLMPLPSLLADPHLLEQAFVNVILNAAQAIEAQGQITIQTRHIESVDSVEIAIADTGPGIPEQDLRRIFDPFFTTKEVGQGTGLGLAVTYGIIEEHGGRIDVASQMRKGTTFTITLPVDRVLS